MKKSWVLASLITLATAVPAFAKAQSCNYTDHFHTDAQNITITNIISDSNTKITKLSDTSFDFHDLTCPVDPNYNTATVVYEDNVGACTLKIKDGESKTDPDVVAECYGNLKYAGYTYDGLFTYGYTLHSQQL